MSAVGLLGAAYEEVRAHRLRAFLAMFSILIGVATLTLIVGLGDFARSTAQDVVERQSGRIATLAITTEGTAAAFGETVAPPALGRLARYAITATTRYYTWPATARIGALVRPESVIGIDPAYIAVRKVTLLGGRWISEHDGGLYAPVVVVNRTWVDEFAGTSALGSRVLLTLAGHETSARVIGIVDDGQRDSAMYAPADLLLRQVGLDGLGSASILFHVDPVAAPTVIAQLTGDFRAEGLGGVQVVRVDSAEDFATLLQLLQLVLATIAGISLVTGSLGIANLGVVTSRQRAREFALRRAFGATRTDIFALVLMETVMATSLGGAFGVLLAGAGIWLIGAFAGSAVPGGGTPAFPVGAAVVGLAASIATGVIAGLVPARDATRASIIEAIRS
jgi:putative ABC transport system permease protein